MVAVNVHAGYPTGNINAEQGSITVVGDIAWADLTAKLNELFPASLTSGIGQNPLDPQFGIYRCQSCEYRPFPNDAPPVISDIPSTFDATFAKMPVYEKALLTINYSSAQVQFPNSASDTPDKPDGSTEVTGLSHQISSGGEVITLEHSSLVWSHGKNVEGTNVSASKVVPTLEHSITWNRVLSPNWDKLRDLIGKVNNTDLGPFQTGTMYNETLLYLGYQASPDITADGTRVWNLSLRFSERRVTELCKESVGGAVIADGITGYEGVYGGWNHFYIQEPEFKITDVAVPPVPAGGKVPNPLTSGFRRLHSKLPGARGPGVAFLAYVEDAAIYKKADLTLIFVQV